jgi:hypothetical protein
MLMFDFDFDFPLILRVEILFQGGHIFAYFSFGLYGQNCRIVELLLPWLYGETLEYMSGE